MKISHKTLQDFFDDTLPPAKEIGELLTAHAFEIESVDEVGDDSCLDVKVLPDRSHDCLSHFGIARELALHGHLKLKKDRVNIANIAVPESNCLKVEIQNAVFCKRFSAVVIENVKVRESPAWMKERLATIGQRSINNIVDATNYVMFLMGQPLHAYDRDLLEADGAEWKLVVRDAHEGEILLALDNKEYTLSPETVVVGDGNSGKALGIAGIKGGKASEIGVQTKHIILEAANFHSVSVRKTAKRLSLRTDASVRFENNITAELTKRALKAVTDLILELAGTEDTHVEGMVDAYPKVEKQFTVGISAKDTNDIVGTNFSEDDVEKIITLFEWQYKKIIPENYIHELIQISLDKPYDRLASTLRDAPEKFSCGSLVNWILKECGFPTPRIAIDMYMYSEHIEKGDLKFGDLIFTNTLVQKPKNSMIYSQVLEKEIPDVPVYTSTVEFLPGTPFVNGIDHVGIYVGDGQVFHSSSQIGKSTIEDLDVSEAFSNACWFGRMVEDLTTPQFVVRVPFERLDIRLREDLASEIGRTYGYKTLMAKPINPVQSSVVVEKKQYYQKLIRGVFVEAGFSEVMTYAFQKTGQVELQNPLASDKAFLRESLVTGLSEARDLNMYNIELLGLSQIAIFELGNVFTVEGEFLSLGFTVANPKGFKAGAGDIHAQQSIATLNAKLGTEVIFTETDGIFTANLTNILDALSEPCVNLPVTAMVDIYVKPYSEFPFVLRDIAVFLPEEADPQKIIEVIDAEAGNLFVNSRLFDTFTKEFPEGKKISYAYRLVFQSMEKTLSDAEITPIMDAVTQKLNSEEGFTVR